ncbi:MAG: hypothetical protein AAGA92_14660 [Planctomycetota bacterium]
MLAARELCSSSVRPLAGLLLLSLVTRTVGGQTILADTEFLAGDYVTSHAGQSDIRFNIDYGNLEIFGDGSLVATLPPAPRSTGGETTGVFISANNDASNPLSGQASFSAILPQGLNIGSGTAHEDFKMTVDVFNSFATGLGGVSPIGSASYGMVGINQSNSVVQVANLNAPSTGVNLPGQGLRLAVTATAAWLRITLPSTEARFIKIGLGPRSLASSMTGTLMGPPAPSRRSARRG